MARGWTCPRCWNKNGEGTLNCAKCGLIRGGVVVPAAGPPANADLPAAPPAVPEPPASASVGTPLHGWQDGSGAPGWVVSAEAPRTGPSWTRIPAKLIVLGLIFLIGGAITLMTNAIRMPTGDIAKSGDLPSHELAVGDCWDIKDRLAESFDTVIGRPCSEEHEFEVFYMEAMPPGGYPTEEGFQDFVGSVCIEPFAAYVGKPFSDSAFDISWITPTEEGWRMGDRDVGCSVEDPGNWRLVGSAKDSKR